MDKSWSPLSDVSSVEACEVFVCRQALAEGTHDLHEIMELSTLVVSVLGIEESNAISSMQGTVVINQCVLTHVRKQPTHTSLPPTTRDRIPLACRQSTVHVSQAQSLQFLPYFRSVFRRPARCVPSFRQESALGRPSNSEAVLHLQISRNR